MYLCFGSERCPLQKKSPAHLPKPLYRHTKARAEEEVQHLGIMFPLKPVFCPPITPEIVTHARIVSITSEVATPLQSVRDPLQWPPLKSWQRVEIRTTRMSRGVLCLPFFTINFLLLVEPFCMLTLCTCQLKWSTLRASNQKASGYNADSPEIALMRHVGPVYVITGVRAPGAPASQETRPSQL